MQRHALHCVSLCYRDPVTREDVSCFCPPPRDFERALEICGLPRGAQLQAMLEQIDFS